jgi:four helix bundle protein
MRYARFEELPVWQTAIDLSVKVFALTEDPAFRFRGDIANQIQRASLSVSNNIAEGFERGTTQELLTFIYIARGSAGEVRSILCVIERMPVFDHLKSQISDLKSMAESTSRQLRGWADSLQNTELTGTRYVTDKSRTTDEEQKRATAFMAKLKRENEERLKKILEERKDPKPKSP